MGILWNRAIDNGNGQVPLTDLPLNGSPTHVTQFDSVANTRFSWDTNGTELNAADNVHFTNQNLPKHNAARHTPNP
jgi:hypothetical protein